MSRTKSPKINILGCALALGVTWGIAMVIAGWTSIFGWGSLFVSTMHSVYIGYEPSFLGGVIGGIWGFADGFVGGFVFSFFYNLFRK